MHARSAVGGASENDKTSNINHATVRRDNTGLLHDILDSPSFPEHTKLHTQTIHFRHIQGHQN